MTRRERLERKAELRREWAQKRTARADAAFSRAHEIGSHIPMGQPILVGHHSERHARADAARIDGAMRAGCESADMAKHHTGKAAGIEQQLERTIFSDDADAVEQLQAKIEKAEKWQETMKAVNGIIRRKPKNEPTPDKLAELVALGIGESVAGKLFTPDFAGRIGFPDYETKNNNTNIRRMKERVASITATTDRKEAAAEAENGVTIEGDTYVRVTFAERPDRDILDALKAAGFCWRAPSWIGRREAIPDCVRDLAGMGPRIGALQWWATQRTHGGAKCKAIIRCGRAYLWPVGSPMAAVTDIDNGHWMEHTDFTAAPWTWVRLTDAQRANFEATARDCYCYQGVDRCDFCTGTRTPDGAPSSWDTFGIPNRKTQYDQPRNEGDLKMKVMQGQMEVEVQQLTTISDCGEGDNRFVLEEDENGLLYETSNANSRQLVNSGMFMGWGDEYLRSEKWLSELTDQFEGDRAAAERYVRAASDDDK